jgi:tetratricopeptide (TPR) repeat protein
MRVFEQIRTIRPDDEVVRKQLVDLNLRMGLKQQALAELENFINYLESNNRAEEVITFLEDLLKEHDDQPMLKRALAVQLQRAGRMEDAVSLLDMLGESLIQAGNKKEALDVINQIVLMNPPNVNDYRQVMIQLQAG